MQTDDQTPVFFASGSSGTQGAPWMVEGHVYTFILLDDNGAEIAWARFKRKRTVIAVLIPFMISGHGIARLF
jgi:hypothetical protein